MTPATAGSSSFTYSRYVTFSRTARTLACTAATVATGVAATVLVTGPAHAGLLPFPVDCQTNNVVLDRDNTTYELSGTCGVVTVTGDNVTVTDLPATRKLLIKGQNDHISGKPVDRVVLRGRDSEVTVRSARVARVYAPGSVLHVRGLLEVARIPGNHTRVHADKITKLFVDGNRNAVRADRGETLVHNDGRHNRIRVHKRA